MQKLHLKAQIILPNRRKHYSLQSHLNESLNWCWGKSLGGCFPGGRLRGQSWAAPGMWQIEADAKELLPTSEP
eukprot:4243714-Amphidinium_carterae.1